MALVPWPTTAAAKLTAIAEIRESTGSSASDAVLTRIGETAAALVQRYASEAPRYVKNEAAIRCAGWLLDRPRDGRTSEVADVGPIKIDRSYLAGQLGALRHSGAMALLSPFKIRRAGVI